MKLKAVSGLMLTLLFVGMLTLAFNIQQAEALEPPATKWTRTYGGARFDGAWSVVETSDGGYALAGYTASFGAGPTDAWLVKVDSSGNMEWSKTYGGADPDWAYSIVETSDHGYALAGFTESFGTGYRDFWLVKTDSSGNHQWNKTYGGASADEARSVVQTSDGGYALAGETWSFGAGWADFWLVKVAGPPPPPPPPPVGGKAIPIKAITKPELQIPWIWLTTVLLAVAVVTVVYVKKRKREYRD